MDEVVVEVVEDVVEVVVEVTEEVVVAEDVVEVTEDVVVEDVLDDVFEVREKSSTYTFAYSKITTSASFSLSPELNFKLTLFQAFFI